MKVLRSYPVLAFTLVLLSIVGACIAQNNVGLILIAGTLAALSWYVTEGPRGRSLPRWVANLFFVAATLNIFVDLGANREDFIGVLGRFAVWLTVIKLYERKTARDHGQLLLLSVLLMFTGVMQSTDLLFGVVVVLYAAIGLYVLLLYQLFASRERSRQEQNEAVPQGYRLAPPARPVIGRRVGFHFRSTIIAVGVLGLFLSAVVFVMFPRGLGAGIFPSIETPLSRRETGYTDEIQLLEGGRITTSQQLMMHAQLLDRNGNAYQADGPLYLRGAALENYVGRGRWTRRSGNTSGDLVVRTREDEMLRLGTNSFDAADTTTLSVDSFLPERTVFTLYAPVAMSANTRWWISVNPQTLELVKRGKPRRMAYQVQSIQDPTDRQLAGLSVIGGSSRTGQRALQNSRIRAEALRLLRQADLPLHPHTELPHGTWNERAASVFQRYLRSRQFTYTLDLSDVVIERRPNGRRVDPIEHFLLKTKRGHCEYYASAFAALCYNVGIEVRVVSGFLAHDYDDQNERYEVVAANAHAWNEVRTGRLEWTTFDPTPTATVEQLTSFGQDDFGNQLRNMYQRLDGAWNENIIDFDAESQQGVSRTFDFRWAERFGAAADATRQWLSNVNRAFKLGPAGYIWLGIVSLALIIAVIALVKLMRRSLAVRRALRLQHLRGQEYQRMLRQLGFYLDMLDVLKRSGRPKPEWRPPLAFAESFEHEQPEAAGLVRRVTELFYKGRYGRDPLQRDEIASARSMIGELASHLGVRFKTR